jgi:hypothetical protein
MATHWRRRSFHPGCCIATVFLLDIIDSKSLHGPVRELHQDNKISNQIILLIRAASVYDYNMPGPIRPLTTFPAMISRFYCRRHTHSLGELQGYCSTHGYLHSLLAP